MLDGTHIRLRPYRRDDLAFFAALMGNEQAMRQMDGTLSADESARLFARILRPSSETGLDSWVVELKSTGEIIGHAALKPPEEDGAREILFVLHPSSWGKGFGTETAKLVLDFAVTAAKCRRVIGTVDPDNAASIRVLEKIGMRLDFWAEDEQGKYPVYVYSR